MGRPREFDIDKAHEDAMNVFWQGGYKGTSLSDLLSGLDLSRGSFYKAFGGKKKLFMAALALYHRTVVLPAVDALKGDTHLSGSERIEAFFKGALSAAEEGDRRGCLLCNAAAGAASGDADIAGIVSEMMGAITEGLASALKDCQRFSDKKPELHRARAQSITMAYIGFKILVRSGADLRSLHMGVRAVVDDLKPA